MKTVTNDNGRAVSMSAREAARQLDSEIVALREELSGLVAELDRRRHEAFDVKLQARRHGLELALTGVALIAAASGFVWLKRRRARPLAGWRGRLERLRDALMPSRRSDERRRAPRAVTTILVAAANAGVAALIKKGLDRALRDRLRRRAAVQSAPRLRAFPRWPRRRVAQPSAPGSEI